MGKCHTKQSQPGPTQSNKHQLHRCNSRLLSIPQLEGRKKQPTSKTTKTSIINLRGGGGGGGSKTIPESDELGQEKGVLLERNKSEFVKYPIANS